MEYVFYGAVLLLLGLTVALLLALWKRGRGGGADAGVEAELRARTSALEADADELRRRLEAEHTARVEAQTRLESERESLAEKTRFLEEAEAKLKDAFKALSADALRATREEFLGQATERLAPLRELMQEYQKRLGEIEKAREGAYGGLKSHLETLARAHQALQKEAHQLSTALRSPTVRGRWGEMTLRRVVEAAGMSPHCDFEEQVTAEARESRQRPDMVIRLPGARAIVVDSKVPLAAYMDATEAPDDGARRAALARHAQDVRKHVRALGQKAYWDQFPTAPDFAVLFLPGESFFSAALEHDRTLMEDAMKSRVFLATPTTLMALLNVVAHGWRQEEMAANAEAIGETGRELFERVSKLMDHFGRIGDGLTRAAKAYDATIGSYEARVRPSAQRLAQQAAALEKELPEPTPAAAPSRSLPAPADDDAADAS